MKEPRTHRRHSVFTLHVLTLVTIWIGTVTPVSLGAQRPVTPTNWRRHPSAFAVRELIMALDSAAAYGGRAERSDSAGCDGGRVQLIARLFTDSSGHVRKYTVLGGADDAAGDATYYYDGTGQLRLILAHANAVNGTRREDRIYFDSTGVPIYKTSRLLQGPGYPGGFGEPILDPAGDLQALCSSRE